MPKYIDADRLNECMGIVQKANRDSVEFNKRCRATDVFFDIWGMIKEQPTAYVKPIVKGVWLLNDRSGFKIYDCSNCGVHMEAMFNFCPFCGAEMEIKKGEKDGI